MVKRKETSYQLQQRYQKLLIQRQEKLRLRLLPKGPHCDCPRCLVINT